MTENLLLRVEEKILVLLTEVESLRKQIRQLKHENSELKNLHVMHTNKLQDLISLLDETKGIQHAEA